MARRSAYAVYQDMLQEQHDEQQVSVPSDGAVNDSSPEVASKKSGRKRKRPDKKTAKKKRKLEEGVEAQDDDDVEPVSSKVKNAKLSKWKKSLRAIKSRPEKIPKKKKKPMYNEVAEQQVQYPKSAELPNERAADDSTDLTTDTIDYNVDAVDQGFDQQAAPSAKAKRPPFFEQFEPDSYTDSREAAKDLFSRLIHPMSPERFYKENWERLPMLIRRGNPHYNAGWFSTAELDQILRQNPLEFTTNIDITTYTDGQRQTHNPVGRAYASTVWEFFKEGCSVRLLNPQTYSNSMWLLNSTLQEYFNSCVGANIYLTPAGSQGFAPHYDDIEAFVMQLEGKKQWKLYPPISDSDYLPRTSSGNFTEDEIGDPFMNVTLEPGDLLYFPRGTIHQASTLPDSHSLHVTLSTYQMNSWGNFLEKLVPVALQNAITEDVEFREGLPRNYLLYMGVMHSESDDKQRSVFVSKVSNLMSHLLTFAPIDAAADQMAADRIHDSLPPCLSAGEESVLLEHGNRWVDGEVEDGIKLTAESKVKVVRHGVMRLVLEDDSPVLYYTTQNSRIYHEKDLQGMPIHCEDTLAVEYLLESYPNYVTIESLPMEQGGIEEKVDLCYNLFTQGLLLASHH